MMNLTELTIFYLACGAPFGVYYYYQVREFEKPNKLIAYSLLITLFWFIYAIKLLHQFVTKRLLFTEFVETKFSDSIFKTKITEFEKKFSQILLEEKINISIFEFRETMERYAGLTREIYFSNSENESELYLITNHENKNLATKCLERRNRSRLLAHQTAARLDFFKLIKFIKTDCSDKEKVRLLAFGFVKLISDDEAQSELHKVFQNTTQSEHSFNVNEMEKEVWNPIAPKPLQSPKKALNFKTLPTAQTMLKPD